MAAASRLSSASIGSILVRTPARLSSPVTSPSSVLLLSSSWAPLVSPLAPRLCQRRHNASFRRHGKAVEPPPPSDGSSSTSSSSSSSVTNAGDSVSASSDPSASAPPRKAPSAGPSETLVSEILGAGTSPVSGAMEPLSPGLFSHSASSSSSSPPASLPPSAASSPGSLDGPLQLTLHSPSVASHADTDNDTAATPSSRGAHEPPYLHHFDSYTAVTRLHEGGYTMAQAILLMKSMRGQLSMRLTSARAQLLSKSNVENEIYLFRAACSELGNEIKNNRRVADEQMRRERTHLQHELDIVSQSISQEIAGMNDAVKGMIGDRSMSRREEHKARESAIQQLNYKISILLTSDTKAEIETIRWILIRRAVLGILFMAVISISLMRYTSLARKQRQKDAADEKRRREKQRALDAAAQTVANQVQGHVPPETAFLV